MKKAVLTLLLVPILSWAAGHDQGSGENLKPFVPSEAFSYECEARLEQMQPLKPGQEVREMTTIVSIQNFEFNNRTAGPGEIVKFSKSQWRNYKKVDYPSSQMDEISVELVPYSLEGHFASMSFYTQNDQVFVSLRANLFLSLSIATTSFASTDFSSSLISQRVHLSASSEEIPVTLTVTCWKK